MATLSEVDSVQKWLRSFNESEQELISALIDEILLVSRDDFVSGMLSLMDSIVNMSRGGEIKVAFFAEQPIKKVFGRIPVFFENSLRGRADGHTRQLKHTSH